MKKILSFVMFVVLCVSAAHAQERASWKSFLTSADKATWKGVRLSYDHANMRFSGGNDLVRLGYNGLSVGYVQSFLLGHKLPLFLETGGGVNFLRRSYDGSEDVIVNKYSTNIFALSIPVNVVYKVRVSDRVTVKPYTGLCLRLNLMAKQKYEGGIEGHTVEDDINLFGGDDAESWKRVQLGWRIGASAEYGCYSLGLGYAVDFNSIADESRFGTLSLTLGMNF